MTENERIINAFTEIFSNYSCLYERKDLEALPHDVQLHIADVYYKRPFDKDDYDTYDMSRELDREILKAININDFKKIIGIDELRENGVEITDIKTKNPIGNDLFFAEPDISDDDIQSSFDEGIKEISFRNANDESVTFTSYTELKKSFDNPNDIFFHQPVQRTSVRDFSSAGAEKLREMTENDNTYIDFLKFQGRVFKHNASVALEFFTQRPETKFIATREQWERSKRTVAQGSEAIRFVDSNGKNTDFYDFSQVEETNPPYQWTINKNNANEIKKQLGIPEKMSIISGVINSTVKPVHITSCMSALGIPPKNYREFSKSYVNAIQLVIAGRLEVGGSNFNIPSDLTALKMLKTESQKLAFLTYAAKTAREALMKIERVARNVNAEERIERNELREMENSDTTRTAERSGRRTSDNTAGNVGEQPDRSESHENGRHSGLGNDTESPERQEHEMVSGVQNENGERSEVLVQVRPDMRTLQSESNGLRAVDGGRTDRDLWNEMDGLHGGELSASGGGNETVSQVSDSGTFGGQESTGLQGLTGRPVRRNESTSDGLRESSEVGTVENVLLGQHSDEGDSLSSGDRSIEEKLNTVFSSVETEKTSTEAADVFVLSDEERLVQITAEIGEKEKTFTNLANAEEKDYNLIADVVKEIQEMKKIQVELKERIQAEPLTKKDVELLFEIEPPKKSVQNMTEPEVAKTIKFESMLDKEMGGKSPYAMRKKGGNDWRNDESKKVKITEVQPHSTSRPEIMADYRDPNNLLLKDSNYLNPDTGATIFLDKDGISETIAKAMVDKKHSKPYKAPLAALYHIEDLIENSVCFDSQISKYDKKTAKNKSPNTMMMHRFYGVIKYNDDFYLTNMAVEETYKSKDNTEIDSTQNHLYSLRGIKITPIGNLGLIPRSSSSTDESGSPSSVIEISIPQLYEFVKSFDASFFENPDAVGREAREAEKFLQAEYADIVNDDKNKSATKEQVIEFAKSHNISVNKAKEELERAVERYDGFIADEKKNKGFSEERNRELEICIHKSFDKIRKISDFTEKQLGFIDSLEKFSITNHVINNMVNSAFEKSSRFSSLYISEDWIDSSIFNENFSEIKNALNEEIKMQMELLKQEKAMQADSEEQAEEQPTVEENTEIDFTKGVLSAPQIQIASSDWIIDMENTPQIIFLETDNSDGKLHFNETVFTYDIENVAIDVQESFDNLYGFDNNETLSVEEGTSQISELMEFYMYKNMHINVTHENGESESLTQYINHASNDYPIIKASPNKQVPEFAEFRTCTVEEYNDLLAEASKNIPEGQSFKLHFNVILSDKRSYSETFELTRDTGKLSEILTNSENNNKSNRNFLKALKMISEQENSLNMSETKSDSNNTPENPPRNHAVSIKRKREILDDFAKRNGLEKINIWRKSGNPASYRVAETANGDRLFNEQLCILEKGEILSEEKLLKSLEEFEKSDFLIQYKQKKTESISESQKTSENQPEYPFVSVKAGWNYEYIAPELEEKDYTVPEFNEALKKLNERWNSEEYETKSAFVTLTIHISETESFEKRLNAEYQFSSLSSRLEYETDWTNTETELRKAVKIAENNATTPELTEKEKAFLNGDIAPFMAKSVLAWDEIEDIGYLFYEKGYTDRHAPNEKFIYGNGLHEPELYDMVKRMQNGEDVRKELTLALLGSQKEFITNKGNEFKVEYGDEHITAHYGNAERHISYEDMGNAFFNLIEGEYNDIVHSRTLEDLQYVIPDLSDENAEKLISAFDSSISDDWQNDSQKQQEIRHSLHDVLDDEELTEKAFASIADMKYNYKPDLEQNQTKSTYKIYQLPDDEKYHGIRFTDKKTLENEGIQLNSEDYNLVYENKLSEFRGIHTLEDLYRQFNTERLADFSGRSLSVSDVIVIETVGEQKAYYCDTMGFTEMPQFFLEKSLSQKNSESQIQKSVDDLKINDVIRYDGETWRISNIRGDFSVNLENTDKNSVNSVKSLIGDWKEQLERDGFEYVPNFDENTDNVSITDNSKSENALPETRFTALSKEIKEFYELFATNMYINPPEETPWGEVNSCDELNKGIFRVSTPSHGGIMINSDIADKILSPEARKVGFREKGFHCYEEDCDASVAERELLDKGIIQVPDYYNKGAEKYNESINEELQRWHTDYWDKREQAIFNALPEEKQAEITGQMSLFGESVNTPENNWRMYIIPDIRSWVDKSVENTPIEYYDTFEEAKARFNELRKQSYNNDSTINPNTDRPYSHLVLGIDKPDAAYDILHVINGQNYLIDDFTRDSKQIIDDEAKVILSRTSAEIGFDKVHYYQKLENGNYSNVPEDILFSEWDNKYFEEKVDTNINSSEEVSSESKETVQNTNIYRIVTYSHDSGADDKEDYATIYEAIEAGRQYLADDYYDGYAVLNTAEHRIEIYGGNFPRDGIFSEQVYGNSETYVPVPNRPTAEKLYNRFAKMFPDIISGEHTCERYGNKGDAYEPLSVEHLGNNVYGLMTYYIQNGDIMRDPDFTFKLDHKNKTLNILEYQQDGSIFGTIYQRVYDENNVPDLKLLSALEKNFIQNLRNIQNSNRPLTAFTDKNGNTVNTDSEKEIPEPQESEINDNTPELREVLNEFSEKYGLGELNVEPTNYNWKLSEKFQDGTDFMLGELTAPEYGKPFTSNELKTALEKFEHEVISRNQNVSEIYDRKLTAESHGGVSELPKVQKNLPEITYASRPSEKISNNISAIREMIRLENAEKSGENPYDSRSNQYNSKQASEYRLRQYCGWGGLSQVFDERFKQYNYSRQELQKMLTPEEYSEAKASSLNAHYTPQIIIDAMYKAVKNMDLPRDAKILEPACGTGNFISRIPHSFGNAEVTGVELDSVTARIAHQINRDNENVHIINSGFENSGLENNSFDLAIGNVPFGDYNMNDPDYVQDWLIHDAFFRKALDKVSAGRVVAFVTSTGTMDKSNPKIREYLATQAELIGAVRLPKNAFSDAGTGVPSDIIFLKKRENPLQAHEPKPDWCYTIPDKNGLKINSYFVQNPQMVLGEMKKTTFQDRLTCEPFEGADLEKQLNEAIKNLNAKITVAKREKVVNEQRGKVEPWGKNFTFQIKDDKVYYRKGSQMDEIKCTQSEKEMIKKLCEIRDITRKLIDLQKTSVPDSELIPVREELNKLYDEYRSEHGELSSKTVKKLFSNDSDFPILQSLENHNKETGKTEKADIFFRRTVNPVLEIKSVESVEEALQISLDRKGKPDIPYMAILIDQSPEKVCNELLEKGQIFIDPEKELPDKPFSGVVERSEYLSGNVRMKLTIAEEYAKTNPEYNQNVDALKTVIPEDIKAEEISVQMGCSWIEPEDYTEFLEHLSGRTNYNSRRCDVSYSSITGEFSVLNAGSKQSLNLNETTTYGTADYNMYQLAEKILNQRRIVVQREKVSPKDPSRTVTRTDPKATKIALEKAKLIREEFKKWIFADEKRKARYERKYNDIFNSIVGRNYDGSHLTFAGITNDFALRPHQKNCVARAIYGGNTLAAHVVGAGKSAVIFTSVMKKKELGLINKACVVVPKALTEQTANEWRKVYLDAKILTVTNDDLSNETKRNLFTAKVATGSYDAVILSQEQFEKIPMSKAYRAEFIQKEIDGLEDMLREKKIENHGKKDYSVKSIEKSKKQLQVKLEKLLNPKSASKAKDDLLEFEQLGFDYLVCDEAHAYKNGFVTTKMTNVSGVTTRPSGRAEDMQMKTDYFNEQFGQGHILFATGTPVSNSMTELYVMTRYLRPDLLKQAGVERFDDWAATFGNVVTKNQQTADGTLKMKTSFASFANLPELMAMYKEFADVQSADKLNLPRPELKTGKPQIISVPATLEQKAYVSELAERAKAIESGTVEPHEDNYLKITGEARLIGLGNNAVKALYEKRGEELPYDFIDDKNSKVDKCVEKVAEIYSQTQDTKGVQIIFSDIAVNSDNGNFSVYDYMKNELVAKGIPEDEIIFAPKADSKERENIFRDINNSKYRVVIASTSTLGTGANIQQNLCALHHIDVPWKPSDFEQREGRILRQGNQNKEVEIFNYVTEGTLDSYLYQTVTNKARFIAQLLDDKAPARVSEDCDEKVLTYGEIQAAAEGNPDFKRRIEVSNEIAELTMLKNDYVHETALTKEKIERIPKQIETQKELLSHVQNDKKSAEKIRELALSGDAKNPDYVIMTKDSVNAHLLKMAQEKLANPEKEIPSVNINNFEVSVYLDDWKDEVYFQVRGESTYSCVAGTAENQDNYQRIRNLFEKGIPKKEQEIMKAISALEENLEQAKERVEIPFSHEAELEEKIDEFKKLEEKLSGLSVQEDVVFDPEEEPIIETAEEKSEREKIYNVDDDDYQPTENDDDSRPIKR